MDSFYSIAKTYKKHFVTHNKIHDYKAHSSKVHCLGWNCDGKRLASGSFDKSVAIHILENMKMTRDCIFRGHGGSIDSLCWHPSNPDLVVTASLDKTVRVWDAKYQKVVATVATKGENININWSPDGNTIAVGNKEDLVTFIDVKTFKITSEQQCSYEVNEITWNKKGNLLFYATGDGNVNIISYPDLKLIHKLKGHTNTCICIQFDPTGKYFATGGADSLVSLWDAEELACIRVVPRLDWPVRTVSFSYDGKLLASGSEDLFIDVSEVETGIEVLNVPIEAGTFAVSWHPSEYLLAYACDDKDIRDRDRDAGTFRVYGFSEKSFP